MPPIRYACRSWSEGWFISFCPHPAKSILAARA
jgi:hypothetical protein